MTVKGENITFLVHSLLTPFYVPRLSLHASMSVATKDKNIGNNGYIGTLILRIYRIYQGYIGYIKDISVDILEKNIDRLKIVKNS